MMRWGVQGGIGREWWHSETKVHDDEKRPAREVTEDNWQLGRLSVCSERTRKGRQITSVGECARGSNKSWFRLRYARVKTERERTSSNTTTIYRIASKSVFHSIYDVTAIHEEVMGHCSSLVLIGDAEPQKVALIVQGAFKATI